MVEPFNGFRLDRRDPAIPVLMLDRPAKRNSLPWLFWRDLGDVLSLLDADGRARVAIIEAEGCFFSAGMDFDVLQHAHRPPDGMEAGRFRESLYNLIRHLQRAVDALERVRFPVIAGIQGGCVGAGLDLVCAAALRYCTDDAWFQAAEVDVGLAPDMGTLQRLPRLIPTGVATELALTGRALSAADAARYGFVAGTAATVPDLSTLVRTMAGRIAAKSPLAIAGIKSNLLFARDHPVASALDHVAAWNAALFVTDDIAASITARQGRTSARYDDLNPLAGDWMFASPKQI